MFHLTVLQSSYSKNHFTQNGIMSPANNYDANKKVDIYDKNHIDDDGFLYTIY